LFFEAMTKGRAIRDHVSEALSDAAPSTSALTVQEFIERWLTHVSGTKRPTTAASYAGLMRRYVVPVIGPVPLKNLKREHIDAVLSAAVPRLNSNTTRLLRAVLGIALHRAERWEIMGARNVVRLTDPPRVEPKELILLRASDARRLLDAAAGTRLEIAYVLALFCGLRRGEILALRWRDIDFERKEIHVRNTMHQEKGVGFRLGEAKSLSSRRSISMSATVAAALAAHRERQIEELHSIADNAASSVDWALIVTSHTGKPLSKSTMRDNFRRLLKAAGLPIIRIHDLRHSCASILLGEGVAAQTVSKYLGHSEVKTTLDIYGHVSRSQTQEAAITMDHALGKEYSAQQSFNWLTPLARRPGVETPTLNVARNPSCAAVLVDDPPDVLKSSDLLVDRQLGRALASR
jgi:integrase